MPQKYRVIQWATGKVGKQTLKGIGDYPKHWEVPPGDGGYRIVVEGEPDMQVQWATRTRNESFRGPLAKHRGPGELALMGGLMGTAARAVNSIPELCRAEPGIVTLCDQSPLLPPVNWRDDGAGEPVGAVVAGPGRLQA
jgi:2,4-diaminopentanoate dehydrogenase